MVPFRFPIIARMAEGDGSEAAARSPGEGQAFPLDYVRELRAENKGWRLKAAELEGEVVQAREALAKARTEVEARVIQAEVRALAARAGMVDPDGVKLMDLGGVRVNAAGDVEGAEAAIEAARTARPWLFGNARTANPEPPPRPRDTRETRDARQMTTKEYAAARRERAWRR